MEQLNISLFDPLQIALNDDVIPSFRTQKVVALLVYLAAEPETAHRRETLMTLLWPGMPDSSARANLRQVLFRLKQAIPDFVAEGTTLPLLITNRQTIQLNPAGALFIDTVQFETYLQQVQTHDHVDLMTCQLCRQNLVAATKLYSGHFLADFYLDDSNEFEEWAEIRRQQYLRQALDALETLTTIALRQQAYAEARLHTERQLELDDLRENAYRQLMEILVRSGQRNEALAVYEKCRRHLMEELAMAPASRTTALYEQILAGDLRFGQEPEQGVRGYEIQDEIGAGAYGIIHRATQSTIGREVAVKIIRRRYANNPTFIRRFEAEAQTIARLEHPHIVPLYDYWRDPDGAYLVMRLLRGGNLLTALEKGPWGVEQTQNLLDQITSALVAAHQQGIVHRDIKPANILFDENHNAYLSDFGIAKDLYNNPQFTTEGGILGTPDYISPEQLQEDLVSPQSDIYSLGAVLYEMLTGEKPFPDVPLITLIQNHLSTPFPLVSETRSDLSPRIDTVIQQATAKRPSDRYSSALEMASAFRAAVQGTSGQAFTPTITPIVEALYNPYKGLRAFQEADADDFYGREGLVEQLISRVTDSRFLAVVGPSGSGKSSAVKAGLIPALRKGVIPASNSQARSDKWFVAEMTPGTHPLDELELALWPIAVNPPPSLVEPMRFDTRGLSRTIRRILPDEEGAQLLLVIDQFEELFTLVEDEERRQFFIDSLLTAVRDPRGPLRVVITLRADFYDRPLQRQSLGQLLKENTEIVLPLSAEELTWAIREPARRVGVQLEAGLAETIVADVSDQPGGLPLLQFALTELFEQRQDGQMTRASYEKIGGATGALGRRADEIYGQLDETGQEATRQLFMRLVTLGEGVEDTRRRVLRSEIESLGEQQLSVVNEFGQARLLTFDHDPITREPTVEVAHEALLREWGQLRNWLDESRNDVRTLRLLSQAATAWQGSHQDDSYLLRGSRLDMFAGWATNSTIAMTASERQFLEISIASREVRQATEEARRQEELRTAQKLAETEHARAEVEEKRAAEQVQATRNLRRRATYLGVALVVAAILAIMASFATVQSNENAETAVANFNIAATQEALAVAAQADALAQAEEAQRNADLAATAEANAEEERAIAEEERTSAQENEEAALAAQEEAVAAQEEALAQAEIARFNEAQAQSLAWTTSARELFASGDGDLALALAIQAVAVDQPPTEAVRTFNDLAYAYGTRLIYESEEPVSMHIVPVIPEGAPLIAYSAAGTMTVWDSDRAELLDEMSIANEGAAVLEGAILPGSTRIAFSYSNSEVVVWDWTTGERVQTLQGLDLLNVLTQITSYLEGDLFAGPDPDTVIALNREGGGETEADGTPTGFQMVAWDIPSGEEIYRIEGSRGEIVPWRDSIATTLDNRLALIPTSVVDEQAQHSGVSRLLIIDLETGDLLSDPLLAEFTGQNYVRTVAVNPMGDQAFAILSDIDDQSIDMGFIISLPLGEVVNTVALDQLVDAAYGIYSPDGTQILVYDQFADHTFGGPFVIFDATSGEQLRQLQGGIREGRFTSLNNVAFTPDGKRLVSGTDDLVVHDLETGALVQLLTGNAGDATTVRISPDGQTAVSVGEDGRLRFWNIALNEAARIFEAHASNNVQDVALSPDGSLAVSVAYPWDPPYWTEDVILWDTSTFEVIQRFPGHFWLAAFLPDGKSVILAGLVGETDGVLETEEYQNPYTSLVHWDIESGEEIGRVHTDINAGPIDLAISPDGTSLLVGSVMEFSSDHGYLSHYDIATLTKIRDYNQEDALNVFGVVFSPDGRTALAGLVSGETVLWDLETGAELRRYAHGGFVVALAFTQDGQRFVSGASDSTLKLWDVATGELIRTFVGHQLVLTSVAFTPDESQMISTSFDGTAILWDMASGDIVRTFNEHSGGIAWQVALSPDGQLAYTAAADGRVIVRPIAPLPIADVLAYVAENRYLHDFTCEEREQYRIFPLCDANGVVPNNGN